MGGGSRSSNDKTSGNFPICATGRLACNIVQTEDTTSLASFCSIDIFSYIINGPGVEMIEDALLQVRKSADGAVCLQNDLH